MDNTQNKARNFCLEVKELAKKYNLPFFIVTEGASMTSNQGCEAVKNARDSHIKWEKEHGYDPNENWKEPFYFYHLVNKDADLATGILSLQYLYDNKMYDLFDKYSSKYENRIINDWNLEKYKGKLKLEREDYLDALNTIRGRHGSNYIYFFKYPPYINLGKKIAELSKYKDIYRINLNDEEVQNEIADIFYGYDMSNSDNSPLDKSYYENISSKEYFSKYDDSLVMNFSTLNHISIAFKNGYCPRKYLEKIEWQ